MTEYEELVERYKIRKNIKTFIILTILILLFGICLGISAPLFNRSILVPATINKALVIADELSEKQLHKNTTRNDMTYDISKIKEYDRIPINSKINKDLVVGFIYIPESDKTIPVSKGLDDNQLNVSVGTAKKDSVMGKGNYVIAGYSITNSDDLFSNIDQISLYSSVYLTDKNEIYEYSVTDKQHKLNNISSTIYSEDKEKMTLITKHEGQYTIVEGKLINKYQYDKPPKLYKLRS